MDQNTEFNNVENDIEKIEEDDMDKAPLSLGIRIIIFVGLC